MATPRITSITVDTLAYLRLLAMAGTVISWPSAAPKLPSVKPLGRTEEYQSWEVAISTTPRCGRIATKVTAQKAAVQSQPPSPGSALAPPVEVALAIIALPERPKTPLP